MATIAYLTQIEFDSGIISKLGDFVSSQGIQNPMLVTDAGLVSTGIVGTVEKALSRLANVTIFDKTPSNPTERAAMDALKLYQESGCDGLVAVGGGSSIDLAKAVSILATHEGPLAQYAAIEGGVAKIRPVSPLVAVPTTSGTGSEVGRAALIALLDGRKLGLISPHLIPKAAVCDPALTLGLSPRLTAATGLDAISHCVETALTR